MIVCVAATCMKADATTSLLISVKPSLPFHIILFVTIKQVHLDKLGWTFGGLNIQCGILFCFVFCNNFQVREKNKQLEKKTCFGDIKRQSSGILKNKVCFNSCYSLRFVFCLDFCFNSFFEKVYWFLEKKMFRLEFIFIIKSNFFTCICWVQHKKGHVK